MTVMAAGSAAVLVGARAVTSHIKELQWLPTLSNSVI